MQVEGKMSEELKLNSPDVQRLNIKIKPKDKVFLIYGDGNIYNLHHTLKGSKAVVITIQEEAK